MVQYGRRTIGVGIAFVGEGGFVAKLIAQRLLSFIPQLFLVSLIVFCLVLLVPGDPATTLAGEDAPPEVVESIREDLGFNDPLVEQYARMVGRLVQGDLGTSITTNVPVSEALKENAPVTMSLIFVAMKFAILIGVPLGILAAYHSGRSLDRFFTLIATLGVAAPGFFVGMMLVFVFAIKVQWFPSVAYEPLSDGVGPWFRHLVLPGLALGFGASAEITRQLRSAMKDALSQDYIRTAKAKGLMPPRVVLKHALKNAAVPLVTVIGLQLTVLLGGALVMERVFVLNGLGSLAVNAVRGKDLPMLQGIVLVGVFISMLVNLAVDLPYGYFNPRMRAR